MFKPNVRALQGDRAKEEDGQDEIRERCSDVDNLETRNQILLGRKYSLRSTYIINLIKLPNYKLLATK